MPYRRSIWIVIAGALLAGPVAGPVRASSPSTSGHIDGPIVSLPIAARDEVGAALARFDEVRALYGLLGSDRIWCGGPREDDIAAVVDRFAAAATHGLDPADYHVPALSRLAASALDFNTLPPPAEATAFDVLLTDALLNYVAHLTGPRLDPSLALENWQMPVCDDGLASRVHALLVAREPLAQALDDLAPHAAEYDRLRGALARLDRICAQGGWPSVPVGPTLHPGETDTRVPLLRARLVGEVGEMAPIDLSPVDGDTTDGLLGERYTDDLVAAVRSFQARYGLAVDGVVGPETLGALDVSADIRRQQIVLSLERLRWLPRDGGRRQVRVNIAAGRLEVVEEDSVVVAMRAIVGRRDRPTPTLSSRITCLAVNPYWNIPQKLAREDVLPRILADPDYLSGNAIRVFTSWRRNAAEVAPEAVDWYAIAPAELAFKLQQEPGPRNPLGKMKFLFPNPFSVYIHDTPNTGQFRARRRNFSAGCVRIADPMALAMSLLGDSKSRAVERLRRALDEGETREIILPRPVPVHLVYLTAWVDPSGGLNFRDDVYGYDAALVAALFPPAENLALPGPDGTGVEVDEAGAGIVADAAASFP